MAITEDVVDFERERILVIRSKERPPRRVPINATAAARTDVLFCVEYPQAFSRHFR